jgi:hypothetical protein
MPRRVGGRGDPTIRAAILTDRQRMAEAFPTEGMSRLVTQVATGRPLHLTSVQLGHALARADHPRAWEFTHAADRDGTRRWLLDVHDRLEEVTPMPNHPTERK